MYHTLVTVIQVESTLRLPHRSLRSEIFFRLDEQLNKVVYFFFELLQLGLSLSNSIGTLPLMLLAVAHLI
jgi:hypothetical protein